MRCNSGRNFPNPTIVSVYEKNTNQFITELNVPISNTETLNMTDYNRCITNPPAVCYEVAYYNFTIRVPQSSNGYVMASQVNYRINGISNLQYVSNIGATYTGELPAIRNNAADMQNHSARFVGSDMVVICNGYKFEYDFSAEDSDGDRLVYQFCGAYQSNNGGGSGGGNTQPPGPPPYPEVPYNGSYSGVNPLGFDVSINPETGLVSGIAPAEGVYVITVCVSEIRNGVVIATQRKDLQINITNCTIASASIPPNYMLCKDTRSINFANNSSSPLIVSQLWEIFDEAGNAIYSANGNPVNYEFLNDGKYQVRLTINKDQPCNDVKTATVYVYPGLQTDFSENGICFGKPTIFTDYSTNRNGIINEWKWDFGEPIMYDDVSILKNPAPYTYPTTGNKSVVLMVATDKGCRDTLAKDILVTDKPPLQMGFKDSLICNRDTVMLVAIGNGNFTWKPANGITNLTGNTTVARPNTTTTYNVTLDYQGCVNTDSVKINVVDFVSLTGMPDSVVCIGDVVNLKVQSNALQYTWRTMGSGVLSVIKAPSFRVDTTTIFQVTGIIGGCNAIDDIRIAAMPYPLVNAGADTTICYGNTLPLTGWHNGNTAIWKPAGSINNPGLLNPLFTGKATTQLILQSNFNTGCIKPAFDTVVVTVLPAINAFAGRDTSIVIGQPLQLTASGGTRFRWFPTDDLSNPDIYNPVAIFNEASGGIRYYLYSYNTFGCGDTASVLVKVFAKGPKVYIPNAFTPNNDGLNDVITPVMAGFKNLERFSIFNRWGQLIFSSGRVGQGWDGRHNGQMQPSGVYVWQVIATDYNGLKVTEGGTITLVR